MSDSKETDQEDVTEETNLIDQLGDEDVEELADQIRSEIRAENRERINASMGLFSLEVESHQSLEDAHQIFEEIWRGRIGEIKNAESTTKRELQSSGGGLLFGGL